jgi:hypothetical protein
LTKGALLNQNMNQGSFSQLIQWVRRDGPFNPDISDFRFCGLVVNIPALRREFP